MSTSSYLVEFVERETKEIKMITKNPTYSISTKIYVTQTGLLVRYFYYLKNSLVILK